MTHIDTKYVLAVTFATSIVVANITAAKLASVPLPLVGSVTVPAGFVGIGVAFLCSDLLSELYGRDEARAVVNATIVALGVGFVLVYASLRLPPAPFYADAAAYQTVMGTGGVIVAASIVTTLVSQNIDVSVFHYVRSRTGGGYKWLRNVGSTATSQLVDTVLFIGLAFVVFPMVVGASVTPLVVAAELVVVQYAAKLAVAVLDTPLFYVGTYLRG